MYNEGACNFICDTIHIKEDLSEHSWGVPLEGSEYDALFHSETDAQSGDR